MTEYKIETHSHTSEVSPCGRMRAEELVSHYKDAGYNTVIITDHFSPTPLFMNNNLSWKEKVDQFYTGYELAKTKGDELGINVLPSLEVSFKGEKEDYLIYGLTKQWLYTQENLIYLGIKRFSELVAPLDCLIIQAHPFRPLLTAQLPPFIQGVEVYNGNKRHNSQNEKALAHAQSFNLIKTSGSDTHQIEDCTRGGMLFSEPIRSINDFIIALKNKSARLIETV